jgi:hypothetical protein
VGLMMACPLDNFMLGGCLILPKLHARLVLVQTQLCSSANSVVFGSLRAMTRATSSLPDSQAQLAHQHTRPHSLDLNQLAR